MTPVEIYYRYPRIHKLLYPLPADQIMTFLNEFKEYGDQRVAEEQKSMENLNYVLLQDVHINGFCEGRDKALDLIISEIDKTNYNSKEPIIKIILSVKKSKSLQP